MAGINIEHIGTLLRDALHDVVPQWFRTMFLGEPATSILWFGKEQMRGAISEPVAILMTRGAGNNRTKVVDAVLPSSVLLRRVIAIPPSSPATHKDIATLDLLRRTPFKPADIRWVLAGDRNSKSVQLIQWVAKRSDIAHFLTMLSSHGYQVRRFLVEDGQGQTILADFADDIFPQARIWRKVNAALTVAITGIGAFLWLQPALDARAEIYRDTAVLDTLRNEALTLRTELVALNQVDTERSAFLETVLHRTRVVDALRQLTVSMPDSFWASDLLFTQSRIMLNGETAQSAADLVLQLTESNLAFVPALNGSVSRTAEGKERFAITFSAKAANP